MSEPLRYGRRNYNSNEFSSAHYGLGKQQCMFDIDLMVGEVVRPVTGKMREGIEHDVTYIEYKQLRFARSETKKFDVDLVKFLAVFEYKYKDCDTVKTAMKLPEGSAAYAEFMLAKIIGARFFFVIATYGKPPFTFYEFDMNTGVPYRIETKLMYQMGNEADLREKIIDFWENVLHLKEKT